MEELASIVAEAVSPMVTLILGMSTETVLRCVYG